MTTTTASIEHLPELERAALLADPLRRQIVVLLSGEQLCTCHLVKATGASQPTISYHLKALRQAGWVRSEPAGRYTYYALDPVRLTELADALADLARSADVANRRRLPCE